MRENNENSIYAKDWFGKGNEDIETAKILIQGKGPLSAIGFHIQQALEKHLKGFLIHQGWKLRRIHSLENLPKSRQILYWRTLPSVSAYGRHRRRIETIICGIGNVHRRNKKTNPTGYRVIIRNS